MSIEDFDLWTGGIAIGDIDLIQLLKHAVISDMKPETKKFEFSQHIFDKYPKTRFPYWLRDECENIYESCKARFEEGKKITDYPISYE